MKVLLSGAQGVIGRRVAQSLQNRSDLDLISLVSVRTEPTGGGLAVDIGDSEAFRASLEMIRPDVVVHLASLTGQACDLDRQRTQHINVDSVDTLTSVARELGISRIVFASTSALYGDQYDEPVTESAPIVLGSQYARTKYAAERILGDADGIETVSLRIFNVFGPGMPNSLVTQLAESGPDRPVGLRGLDTFVRDYVHVDDVSDAIGTGLTAPLPHHHATFNIGSGVPTSNRRLVADLDIDLSRYTVFSAPSSYSCAQIDSARRWLDFQPSRGFGDLG
ncbi:NAD-dependent epimerase/dehydratase family protein [Cryobacterium sandaracinum]|uniref:NAD-dependent epimerase/dehydratase family protein n=1 Tax=Cryobacterium sandaracinum TaxID=1259247 RepID=UPI00141B9F01|nr:NAD-dependent epimerase/dehydratase family protein [Cryobacterium sandaracinum]